MTKFDESRIKRTDVGFNYVEITKDECYAWGGLGICNSCNKQYIDPNLYDELPDKSKGKYYKSPMHLVFVLGDVYCKECFDEWVNRSKHYIKEDIEYDLKLQEANSLSWYKYHLDRESAKFDSIIDWGDIFEDD